MTLPRPQLTTLAHKNPRPSPACVPPRCQLPAFMPSVRMLPLSRLAARGTNSGDSLTHPDAWPHRYALLKGGNTQLNSTPEHIILPGTTSTMTAGGNALRESLSLEMKLEVAALALLAARNAIPA